MNQRLRFHVGLTCNPHELDKIIQEILDKYERYHPTVSIDAEDMPPELEEIWADDPFMITEDKRTKTFKEQQHE